jgi:mannitol/fructose-specific phosphotransferase system IIA component (Ntr-type)/CBS domain-containing protein
MVKVMKVRDAVNLDDREPILLREEASLYEAIQRMIDAPHVRSAYLVDEQGQLEGILTLRNLVNYIFSHFYFRKPEKGESIYDWMNLVGAIDLANTDTVCVTQDEPLQEAVRKILEHDLQEIPVVDEEGSVVGDLNLLQLLSVWVEKARKAGTGHKRIRLCRFVEQKQLIMDIKSREKESALDELLSVMKKNPHIKSIKELRQSILSRESLVSTGVGRGVAIPHARCSCVQECVIAVGLSREGVDFNALDDQPVHLIFLIAAPETAGYPYAAILARVTHILRDEDRRRELLACRSSSEMLELLEEYDREIETEKIGSVR